MKRNQYVLTFALVYLLPISDQLQLATAANSEPVRISRSTLITYDETLPRISFEKTVFDLGDVGPGTKNECEFIFTNTGRRLLKIGNISRTCGCTVFQLDKKEYAPKGSFLVFFCSLLRIFCLKKHLSSLAHRVSSI